MNIMKIATLLATLIFLFGCNNREPRKTEIGTPESIKTEKSKTRSIYKLIANKIEKSDSLPKHFDFSKNYTNLEIDALQLDTTKIGANEYFFLSDQKFLTNPMDSISFIVYFKHRYGDLLEKVIRVKRTDTIFDLTLSMRGGDGQDAYAISSEFLNDSIFIETFTHEQTKIDNTHLMAYARDSIIKKYHYDNQLNFKEIKKDSFHIYREYPTYHENLKGKVFKTWSLPFSINEMKCNWEYDVKYTKSTNEKSKKILVDLLDQRLINSKDQKAILDLDLENFFFVFSPMDISVLDNNNFKKKTTGDYVSYPAPYSYTNDSLDINMDGFYDFQFLTELAAAGANEGYISYLYNPTEHVFEYSEIFSGYNIEYDSEKNRISSFGKSAVNDYYYSFKNLNNNKRDVDFVERIRHYEDTIFYKKLINEKVVEEKKIVLEEYEGWTKYLERN